VKVLFGPTQLTEPFVKVGVTVIVPSIGDEPLLVPVNDAISPEPEAARPIEVLLLIHVYVVVPPVLFVVNVTVDVDVVLQTT